MNYTYTSAMSDLKRSIRNELSMAYTYLHNYTLNNFSDWSLNSKWNSFRMFTMVIKKCVEY